MKKHIIDLQIKSILRLAENSLLIVLHNPMGNIPECIPGQFVQVRIDGKGTYLRRPISIHYANQSELHLLVQLVGEGTRWMATLSEGDTLNLVMPLGNGFTLSAGEKPLLVGGGVGVAPLYNLGVALRERGIEPTFLLGARRSDMLLRGEAFEKVGRLFVTTEDGSLGEQGFITQHSILQNERFTSIHVCGPSPMMKAVARYAKQEGIPCEVSLENMMACGLGACLCCVEKTVKGNVCVCTEGPVFNIEQLNW